MRVLLYIMLFLWLLVFLWLALWPFDFSRENLANFSAGKGLEFSPPSIALSDGAPSKIAGLDSLAVLLRFFPASRNESGCILDYTPIETATNLRIVQERRQLEFTLRVADAGIKHFRVPLGSPDSLNTFLCFVRGGNVTIMDSDQVVTSAEVQTEIGSTWDRKGQLVFGSTASGKLRWRGTLVSFEVYRAGGVNSFPDPSNALLSYQFAQHSGRLIPDIGREPRFSLLVPARIKAPARKILSSPLTYWDGIWNISDIFNNLIAFIPLGILLGLLFRMRMRKVILVLAATGIACLISLSVESAQYFIPWRDSSIVDVFTDSLGAFFGACLSTTSIAARLFFHIR
jgi:hypothetical protein